LHFISASYSLTGPGVHVHVQVNVTNLSC